MPGLASASARARVWRVTPWLAYYAVLVGLIVFVYRWAPHSTPDDSFIFYRYARNLANGRGWVYNAHRLDGNAATSPAWTLLLAAWGWPFGGIPHFAAAAYALLAAAAGLVMAVSLRDQGMRMAGLAAGPLVVFSPLLTRNRGMESGLLLLSLALVLHLGLVRRRLVPAGVAAGVLMLSRPEGVILAVLVGLIRWRRDRRPPWAMVAATVVTVAPWLVYSTIELGSPLTNTLAAKRGQERSGYFGPSFQFLRHAGQMVHEQWSLALLIAGFIGAVLALRRPQVRDYAVALIAFCAAHVVAYGLLIQVPAYPWYYAAEYFALAVFAGVAVAEVGASAARRLAPSAEQPLTALAVVVAALAFCNSALPYDYTNDRYTGYRLAAAWLRRHGSRDSSVSATEIGHLGWFTDMDVVDYVGLLDRRTADEFGRRDVTSWFLRRRPDFYVTHVPAWSFEAPSAATPEFAAEYEPVFETVPSTGGVLNFDVRVFRRVAPARRGSAATPLLTPWLISELEHAGVPLSDSDRVALGAVLTDYVGSRDDQVRCETPDGVDFSSLFELAAKSPGLHAAEQKVGVARLARAVRGRKLVLPLAPRPPAAG